LVRRAGTVDEAEPLTLIPVDAVSGMRHGYVRLNRSRTLVVGAPAYRREKVDETYLESV
jgi:hypothetical protein